MEGNYGGFDAKAYDGLTLLYRPMRRGIQKAWAPEASWNYGVWLGKCMQSGEY